MAIIAVIVFGENNYNSKNCLSHVCKVAASTFLKEAIKADNDSH